MSKEYIEREALKEDLKESYNILRMTYDSLADGEKKLLCERELTAFLEAILRVKAAPAADVVEVKHGKFELYGNDDDLSGSYFCSLCGWNLDEDEYLNNFSHFKYCPNCGAKMDGERRENGDK